MIVFSHFHSSPPLSLSVLAALFVSQSAFGGGRDGDGRRVKSPSLLSEEIAPPLTHSLTHSFSLQSHMMEKGREKAANATKAENAIVAKKGSSRGAADR